MTRTIVVEWPDKSVTRALPAWDPSEPSWPQLIGEWFLFPTWAEQCDALRRFCPGVRIWEEFS